MDDFTKPFDPLTKYENFEVYVKLNMKYIEVTEGYKFFTIDSELTNLLLNKSLVDEEKYKDYLPILEKYQADFTYDCEDSIEGYDEVTGKFGRVCRVAFYPKKVVTLSYKEAVKIRELLDDANELNFNKKLSYTGHKEKQEEFDRQLEVCNECIGLLDELLDEARK